MTVETKTDRQLALEGVQHGIAQNNEGDGIGAGNYIAGAQVYATLDMAAAIRELSAAFIANRNANIQKAEQAAQELASHIVHSQQQPPPSVPAQGPPARAGYNTCPRCGNQKKMQYETCYTCKYHPNANNNQQGAPQQQATAPPPAPRPSPW